MKLMLASGLSALLLTGTAGAVVLTAGVPDDVVLPEQAQVPADPGAEAPDEDPDADEPEVEEPELPEIGDAAPESEVGAERRAAAQAFVEAMQVWTTCVGEAAAAHDGSEGAFAPTEACRDRPAPPVPAQAADRAADRVPEAAPTTGARELPEEGAARRELAEEKAAEGRSRGVGGPQNAPAAPPAGRP